ncbi:SDR family NAD(P)-dependent oxidoreductase [Streptomyces flaveolus]|uniref:SDR family NAD(P)-dependent oxidoreductase n=1 Tax=Streptomyces flaveolus TaxID=67297 RepID=UPI0033C7BC0C
MDLNLSGKTAIVTGASRGIGLATVKTLINEGARVAGISRTITPELKASGAIAISADLSVADQTTTAVRSAIDDLGHVDLLVNNAGVVGTPADFVDLDNDAWAATFNTNFFSAVWVTRAVLPSLIERRGAVVNVSSVSARMPSGVPAPYAASKAALTMLTKSLSEELGSRGVRINTVSPGPIRTDLWEAPDGFGAQVATRLGTDHQDFVGDLAENFNVTLGRLAEPEEVAELIAYLLSDRAANITGSDVVTDGGMKKTV